MTKSDLIELLNQIDVKSEHSKLVIVFNKCEALNYYRYDFIFHNRYIAFITSNHSTPIDAIKELGDIDPRVVSRIYLNSNFIDLGELELSRSNYISE